MSSRDVFFQNLFTREQILEEHVTAPGVRIREVPGLPAGGSRFWFPGGEWRLLVLSLALLDSKVAELERDAADREGRLREAAQFIRSQLTSESRGIVDVGQKLQGVRDMLDSHTFLRWLRSEFAWSRPTAWRYMSVAKVFGECPVLEKFQTGALYLLSQRAVSPVARQQAIQMAEQGLPISRQTALTLVRQHADGTTAPRSMGQTTLYNRAIKLPPAEIMDLADSLLHFLDTVPSPAAPAVSQPECSA